MKRRTKDTNRTAAKQVANVTKTPLPKGEDLLGSEELRRAFIAAKAKSSQ